MALSRRMIAIAIAIIGMTGSKARATRAAPLGMDDM
jgi:hypothetical protein